MICCGNNADTNIPTVLLFVFALIILAMLSGFLFKLSPKTKINQNNDNHIKHAQKKSYFMFWHLITAKWLKTTLFYFICAIDEKTYQLRNVENFTSFYFKIQNYSIYYGEHLDGLLSVYTYIHIIIRNCSQNKKFWSIM